MPGGLYACRHSSTAPAPAPATKARGVAGFSSDKSTNRHRGQLFAWWATVLLISGTRIMTLTATITASTAADAAATAAAAAAVGALAHIKQQHARCDSAGRRGRRRPLSGPG